jgi:hypothetical protein
MMPSCPPAPIMCSSYSGDRDDWAPSRRSLLARLGRAAALLQELASACEQKAWGVSGTRSPDAIFGITSGDLSGIV